MSDDYKKSVEDKTKVNIPTPQPKPEQKQPEQRDGNFSHGDRPTKTNESHDVEWIVYTGDNDTKKKEK